MTGYSFIEKTFEKAIISVEIKSVNSRFLDLSINLPSFLNPVESFFRAKISEKIVRGKLDVNIRIKELSSSTEVLPDSSAALSYLEAIKKVALACGYSLTDIPLSLIISQPGVLNESRSYDVEAYKNIIEPVFDECFEKFIADRKREGENLKKDLEEKLKKLYECAVFFKDWQPRMEQTFKTLIMDRFKELLGDKVDENRVMSETAAMLVKYTINEEIVRLFSHLDAIKMEIEKNHNQVEVREFFLVKANSFYQGDEWKDLKSIVCHKKKLWNVHSKTESIEYRYFISDLNDVETISLAIRGHWSVENQLHYSLDKFFNEDANKTIDKIANNNLSLIRKMINTLLVLIAPMFRNGSKMRTLKSFRSNYEINLLRLFKFLDGKDLKELLLQKEKDINLK